jgi:hypothetical protein
MRGRQVTRVTIRNVSNFSHVDAVVIDTPILDSVYRGSIHDVSPVDARIDRSEEFVDYLDEQWHAVERASEVFNWTQHSSRLRAEFDLIRRRVGQLSLGD